VWVLNPIAFAFAYRARCNDNFPCCTQPKCVNCQNTSSEGEDEDGGESMTISAAFSNQKLVSGAV